jgi:hypothetical protein
MRTMIYALFACLFLVQFAAAAWANESFDRCQNITVKNAGSTSLTDFPAYINLTYDSDMLSNYSDLRFYNASCDNGGSMSDYEIENYTASNAHIWVRIPTLPTGNTTISVYYKNLTSVSSGQNITGVWNSNFIIVWHLDENPAGTAPQVKDSTKYGNNGTSNGGGASSDQVAGKIDGSLSFNASASKAIIVPNSSSNDLRGKLISISAWINPKNMTNGYIVARSNSSGYASYGFIFTRPATGSSAVRVDAILNNANQLSSTVTVPFNAWTYVAFTYNSTNIYSYINGISVNNSAYSTNISAAAGSNVTIGMRWPSNNVYNGTIDEIEISNTSLSTSWINQSYQIVANQTGFVIFGSKQSKPSSQQVALMLIQPTTATSTDPFTPFLQNCNASCSGATCTSVNLTAQYSNDSGTNYFDMNSSTQLNTSTVQPQSCGDIAAGSYCNKTWAIAGKAPGTYKIRCRSVSGNAPANTSATPSFDITSSAFVETSISPGSIAFGSFDPGTSNNAASNNPINITVTPNTNVNVDTYASGTNLTNASSTMAIGNMSVSKTSGGAKTALTNSFPGTPYYSNIAPNSIEQYFFYLTVPAGQASGDYTSTITIKTVQTGVAP